MSPARCNRPLRGTLTLMLVLMLVLSPACASLARAQGRIAVKLAAPDVPAGAARAGAGSVGPLAAKEDKPITAYTLPPDELERATRLARSRTLIYIASTIWSVAFLIMLMGLQWMAAIRDLATRLTPRPWLQGLIVLPMVLLALSVADLPLSIIGHHISLAYGQSIEPWGSWLWDWTKAIALTIGGGTLALSFLFAIVRRSERRWWLWFWLLSIPLELLVTFAVPYVVDPLFDHFEPLALSHPALVQQLERVVARSNLQIPPSRMFLMRASEKVTSLNAYVTGFGASKRVVVWDTTIRKCTPGQILFIFGHEQGHYALNHIRLGLLATTAGSLFALWAGFHATGFLIGRFGRRWGVSTTADWAAVGVLLLLSSIFGVLGEPFENAFSRTLEHQADVYGQEVIHGLVPDPGQAAASAFQQLGEVSLDDPYPNRFLEFWTYSHPSISRRVAFAAHYDPWREGQRPRYFAQEPGEQK